MADYVLPATYGLMTAGLVTSAFGQAQAGKAAEKRPNSMRRCLGARRAWRLKPRSEDRDFKDRQISHGLQSQEYGYQVLRLWKLLKASFKTFDRSE